MPRSLPALLRAHRISERVSKVGFDWEGPEQVREKCDEELAEFDAACAAGDAARMEDELGDLLFALVNLARHLGLSCEDALRRATEKFTGRFSRIEKAVMRTGGSLEGKSLEALEALWQAAKEEEG